MSNEQLYLAIGVPILFNAGLLAVFITILLWVLSGIRDDIRELRSDIKKLTQEKIEK